MKRPDKMTPSDLFQLPARYVAPVFQRFYAWGEKELDDFFEDLENALAAAPDRSPQFLGAIVLQERERESPAAPQVSLMIDGQQRLTTLYLVVAGLAALAAERRHTAEAEGLASLRLDVHDEDTRRPRLVVEVPLHLFAQFFPVGTYKALWFPSAFAPRHAHPPGAASASLIRDQGGQGLGFTDV